MNPASFTNQMSQQWDQASPADNQHSIMTGRLPYNTTTQEPYTQTNQHAQNGTLLFALRVMCDCLGHEVNITLLSFLETKYRWKIGLLLVIQNFI